MKNGYYWYKQSYGITDWRICFVADGYVHFFGEVSQSIGCEWVTKYLEFGPKIGRPT